MNILISACLIGLYCRYDGKIKDYPAVSKLFNRPDITLIPCCPEQAGGLPTPRMAAERCGQQVKTCDDRNVTEQFEVGARTACRLAELYNSPSSRCTEKASVLKEKSPSCGFKRIYDGTFSGTLTNRSGVTAQALSDMGVRIYGESEIDILTDSLLP